VTKVDLEMKLGISLSNHRLRFGRCEGRARARKTGTLRHVFHKYFFWIRCQTSSCGLSSNAVTPVEMSQNFPRPIPSSFSPLFDTAALVTDTRSAVYTSTLISTLGVELSTEDRVLLLTHSKQCSHIGV
jgi:hypothetical protein